MAKLSALERKGIGEKNGKIITRPILVEDDGVKKSIRMEPIYKEISSLADYFRYLKEIHDKNEIRLKNSEIWGGSQFFYRGQDDVNYKFEPSIMRKKEDIRREHLLFKEFHRRFYSQLDECKTAMEEETLMQHFGAGSRVLDLMENPLIALWAACFSENKDKKTFGEVSVWCINKTSDALKTYDSSAVSIFANIAKMDKEFLLGNLQAEYKKEHPTLLDEFIYIKDILRGSVVVRPKPNNLRISNQQGCFAIVNLTKLVEKEDDDGKSFKEKFRIGIEDFSNYILNVDVINKNKEYPYTHPNIYHLKNGYHTLHGANFSELSVWDFKFKKILPEESNFVDSYGLYKYLYNSKPNLENTYTPIYFIVPPKKKEDILKELRYMNITKSYIYPEMQNVAKELKDQFCIDE